MILPFYQIDAFTENRFGGNPAAVCPLESWLPKKTLQNIAAENNLSETAFFISKENGFELKWFTPKTEVDLCGHATLAAAFVIFKHLGFSKKEIEFQTKSGLLKVSNTQGLLSMDFPATKAEVVEDPYDLIFGLGIKPLKVLKSRDYLAVYNKESEIKALKPNFAQLKKLECLGVIATAKGDECDFVSRFFAPAVGINEDPVTGSAHTTLIPFWSEKLKKSKMIAKQISKRGGELLCENKGERVVISGKAVTYLKGQIEI